MPKEAVSFISAALYQDGFKVHALRFDYPQSSASMQPYNSVDVSGIKHAMVMIGQFLNKIVVQYLFNLENQADFKSAKKAGKVDEEVVARCLKMSLMSQGHEYDLDKDWCDHREFLKYWA